MTDNDTIYFELKDSGDFIKIELTDLSRLVTDINWDWIDSKVTLKAGGFSGQFQCYTMGRDFEELKRGLTQLYEKLVGTASFDTLEGQVKIEINGDGIGHFKAKCTVMDAAGYGNKLEFIIDFDQTIIPSMIRQLDNIIKNFE